MQQIYRLIESAYTIGINSQSQSRIVYIASQIDIPHKYMQLHLLFGDTMEKGHFDKQIVICLYPEMG